MAARHTLTDEYGQIWCLAVDLARTAIGLFIMLARQSGTLFQMNLETLTASIALHGF